MKPYNPKTWVVISTPTGQAHVDPDKHPLPAIEVELSKTLQWFPGGTILDLWARKVVEAVRGESSEQNHQTDWERLLETLSWDGKPCGSTFQRTHTTRVVASALSRRGPLWMGGCDDVPFPDFIDMPKVMLWDKQGNLAHPAEFRSHCWYRSCDEMPRLQFPVKTFRVMTYVLKFARALVKVLNNGEGSSRKADLSDSSEAERLWIVKSQSALTQDKNFDSWKRQFNLFLDPHSVWRFGGVEDDLLKQTSHIHPSTLCY